jgi:hypothetical protein
MLAASLPATPDPAPDPLREGRLRDAPTPRGGLSSRDARVRGLGARRRDGGWGPARTSSPPLLEEQALRLAGDRPCAGAVRRAGGPRCLTPPTLESLWPRAPAPPVRDWPAARAAGRERRTASRLGRRRRRVAPLPRRWGATRRLLAAIGGFRDWARRARRSWPRARASSPTTPGASGRASPDPRGWSGGPDGPRARLPEGPGAPGAFFVPPPRADPSCRRLSQTARTPPARG